MNRSFLDRFILVGKLIADRNPSFDGIIRFIHMEEVVCVEIAFSIEGAIFPLERSGLRFFFYTEGGFL
jgi:hypothetical protein